MNSHPLTTPQTQGYHSSSIVIYFGEGGHKEESPSGPRSEFGVTGQEDGAVGPGGLAELGVRKEKVLGESRDPHTRGLPLHEGGRREIRG